MHFASDWLWRAGFSISVPISKLHVSPQTKHDTLADLSKVLVLGPVAIVSGWTVVSEGGGQEWYAKCGEERDGERVEATD
jgi:hypothetical protein